MNDKQSNYLLITHGLHGFLQDFCPTKFVFKKSCSPLFASTHRISKFDSLPLFVVPPIDLQYSSFPPTKIFNLCITGLHKLTINTLSTCAISCNTQEQKQVSRSKLMFQIHKQTNSIHNHIPKFRK